MTPRVVFFSAAEISIPCLEYLKCCPDITFAGIVTQPGRAKGRGHKVSLNPVGLWAENHSIPFYQAEKMDVDAFAWLKTIQPDLIFVMAFGHILKKNFLDMPPLGMWNFHTSLLPKYRGASPIQSAILVGDSYSGVTLMSMVEKMDAGPWLAQKQVSIAEDETGITLTQKMAQTSAELLQSSLPKILTKDYTLIHQNNTAASYCSKFSKTDGLLDFNLPAALLERKIRAFQPWPGTYFFKDGERYIIHKAHVVPSNDPTSVCGNFIIGADKKTLYVTTNENNLSIDVLQKVGGKPMPVADFLRGKPNF